MLMTRYKLQKHQFSIYNNNYITGVLLQFICYKAPVLFVGVYLIAAWSGTSRKQRLPCSLSWRHEHAVFFRFLKNE